MSLEILTESGNLHWDFETEPLLVIDPQFRVIHLNRKAREKYRYEGPLPVPCYRLTHGRDNPCPEECPLKEVLKEGRSVIGIHRHLLDDGKILYEKVLASPLFDREGKLVGLVEILVDITPEVEGEIRSRQTVESLLEAFENSRLGILVLDRDFRVVWLNSGIEEFFGLRREEVLGQNKRRLIQERIKFIFEKPEEFAQKVLRTYEDNTYIENFECHVVPAEGRRERWLEHFSQPIKKGHYAGGRVEFYFDITRRKELEREFLAAQKLEVLGRMTAGIAHDFNNILMAIQGFAQLGLIKLKENHPAKRDFERILNSCQRASEIIQKLLTFIKKESFEYYKLDLKKFLLELKPIVRSAAGERITVHYELPEEPLPIKGDETALTQAILNLVINAKEAMPEGGEIFLRAFRDGERAVIEIKDTGIGIPSENLPFIFDPFFTTKELGSGLGLSVVYGIVKSLEGEIQVESTVGEGTTFRLFIPLVSD